MKENWLDKKLQDKISNYDSPMDLEKSWEALEARRKPEEKKRGFIIFWIFGIICISLGGGLSYWIFQSNNNVDKSNFTLLTKNSNSKNALISNQQPTEVYESVIQKYSKSNNSTLNNVVSSNTKTERILEVEINKTTQNNDILSTKNSVNNNSTFNLNNKEIKKSTIKKPIQNSTLNTNVSIDVVATKYIQSAKINSPYSIANKSNLFPTIRRKPIITLNKNVSNKNSSWSFTTGYGRITKGNVLQEESPLDAISGQLLIKKYLFKNVYTKSGISLEQFITNINSTFINSYSKPMDDQLIFTNSYQSGVVEEIRGVADVEIIETTKYNIYNTYQFVNVPIFLGISIISNKRNQFDFETGISTSVYSKYTIKNFYKENSTEIRMVEDLSLKKRGLISGLIGVQWNYYPFQYKQVGFLLKYSGQFQLNTISESNEISMNKFQVHNIMTGVSYRFN